MNAKQRRAHIRELTALYKGTVPSGFNAELVSELIDAGKDIKHKDIKIESLRAEIEDLKQQVEQGKRDAYGRVVLDNEVVEEGDQIRLVGGSWITAIKTEHVQYANQFIEVRRKLKGQRDAVPKHSPLPDVTKTAADVEQETAEACAKWVRSGLHDDDPYIIAHGLEDGAWKEYK